MSTAHVSTHRGGHNRSLTVDLCEVHGSLASVYLGTRCESRVECGPHEGDCQACCDSDPSVVRRLRTDAGAAGDEEQVELCDRALSGDADALVSCLAAIAEARWMEHDGEAADAW